MATFADQIGNHITLPSLPKRIVSLVPSQTELLYDLGLEDEIVGITKFCVHPEKWFREKPRVGGTKSVDINKLRSLQPDLVIANREENVKEQVEEIAKFCPVWTSDISTVEEALTMIHHVAHITGKEAQGREIIHGIKESMDQMERFSTIRTVYLVWKDPYMTVGGDTFISDMMAKAGFVNVFQGSTRYPELSPEDLVHADAELILLSSEPYPFKDKHVQELSTWLPGKKIMLADGEMFSWYGSRMLKAAEYLTGLRGNWNT